MEFSVICINDKNKPSEYPSSDAWVKEGQVYTPIKIAALIGGVIGIQVAEIIISEENPFQYFNISRFGIPADQIEEFDQWVKESLENQEDTSPELDLEKLLEQKELV